MLRLRLFRRNSMLSIDTILLELHHPHNIFMLLHHDFVGKNVLLSSAMKTPTKTGSNCEITAHVSIVDWFHCWKWNVNFLYHYCWCLISISLFYNGTLLNRKLTLNDANIIFWDNLFHFANQQFFTIHCVLIFAKENNNFARNFANCNLK